MNNNSNHNTVWILGLIVVLVLGVLVGTNLKNSDKFGAAQQGAVIKTLTPTKSNIGSSGNMQYVTCDGKTAVSLSSVQSNYGTGTISYGSFGAMYTFTLINGSSFNCIVVE